MKVPEKKPKRQYVLINPTLRACAHCGATAAVQHPKPHEPMIMTISFVVYFRSRGGRPMLRAMPKISLCEECVIRLIAGSPGAPHFEGATFLAGIRKRLAVTYPALAAESLKPLPRKRKIA